MQWTDRIRQVKIWLVVVAILIAAAALIASHYLVRDLQTEERNKMEVWAKAMEALNQDDELFLSITSGLSKYGTQQAMLGGGYSVNWVPLHRNPENPRNGKGLRNLTLNATLLPMLSYYNHIVSEAKTEQGGTITTRFNGNLSLAVTAKAGLGFSWDRYFLNAMVIYNHFGFKNAANTVWQDDGNTRNDIDTKARFFDLTAKIQFSVKF